ncbi:MAG: signal peptidase II, partial [Paracoccaceae bacterium]
MKTLAPMIRTALTVFVLDQITKLVVVHAYDLKNIGFMEVWDPFLNFRMAWNEGINFGIPLGNKWILIALALAICVWIVWWMARER